MNDRVLFVDDEANVLHSIKRRLRKKFSVHTAISGADALEIIKNTSEPFAVIVSDMRMPEMSGVQLLSKVREIAPDTVRIMLTGNADQETAIEAVNQGSIFRFLTKPCPPDLLENSIRAAIEQYRLITAEREILDKTLNGSIKVMTEILSQVSPAAFSRAYRIKSYVSQLVQDLNLPNKWEFSIAALLSQLGCVTLPTDLVEKVYADIPLNPDEQEMFDSHPAVGAKLLSNIPRFHNIASMIAMQRKRFDAYAGKPKNREEKIARIGAQILKAVIDLDQYLFQGMSLIKAISRMEARQGEYNPNILGLLTHIKARKKSYLVKPLTLNEICVGMVLNQDVVAKNGLLLASKGQDITFSLKERLQNFAKTIGIEEPIECRTTA